MPRLPARFAAVILRFAPLLPQRGWGHAEVLLIGAILAPGRRTVSSILRITGLGRERRFTNYHRILNRAAWDPRAASRLLLGLLLDAFAPRGPVLLGLDDTIERRRGKRIGAKGIYRDPVRSSHGHFVKASGLRWLSLMLLVPISWAGRVWALPFLTVLAPSERYCRVRALDQLAAIDAPRPSARSRAEGTAVGPHRRGQDFVAAGEAPIEGQALAQPAPQSQPCPASEGAVQRGEG